jgi:hypothetical protein
MRQWKVVDAGMVHGSLRLGGLVKEAQQAIDEIARFLGREQPLWVSPDPACSNSLIFPRRERRPSQRQQYLQ